MKIVNFDDNHSVISQYMMELRNVDIQHDMLRFRRNLERIGEIMAYEISKTFNYRQVEITTPLDTATCNVIADKVVLGTIFRAAEEAWLPFQQ